jgi:ParB-like chromosome segregation protein Spo0J
MSEARAFQEMVDDGLSAEEIAERESCSVAHVKHYLKLLELPPYTSTRG